MTKSLVYSLFCISLCIAQPNIACWAADTVNDGSEFSENISPEVNDNDDINDILEDDQEDEGVLHTLFEHKGKVSLIAVLVAAGIYTYFPSAKEGTAGKNNSSKGSDAKRTTTEGKDKDAGNPPKADTPPPTGTPTPALEKLRARLTALQFIPSEFVQNIALSQDEKKLEQGSFSCNGTRYQLGDNCIYQIGGKDYRIKLIESKENKTCSIGIIELLPKKSLLPQDIASAIYERLGTDAKNQKKSIPIAINKAQLTQHHVVNIQSWNVLFNDSPKYLVYPIQSSNICGLPYYDGIQVTSITAPMS